MTVSCSKSENGRWIGIPDFDRSHGCRADIWCSLFGPGNGSLTLTHLVVLVNLRHRRSEVTVFTPFCLFVTCEKKIFFASMLVCLFVQTFVLGGWKSLKTCRNAKKKFFLFAHHTVWNIMFWDPHSIWYHGFTPHSMRYRGFTPHSARYHGFTPHSARYLELTPHMTLKGWM